MIRRLLGSQFRINAASGVVTNLVSLGVAAASYPISVHYLGYEIFGTWLVLNSILLVAQILKGAVCPVLLRVVAESYARQDYQMAADQLASSTLLLLLTSVAAMGVAGLILPWSTGWLGLSPAAARILATAMPWSVLLVIPQTGSECALSALAGLGRIDLGNLHSLVSRVIIFVASVLLFAAGARMSAILAANIVGATYLWIVVFRQVKRYLPQAYLVPRHWSLELAGRVMRVDRWMAGATTLAILVHPLNRLLVSRLAGPSLVPVYEMAFTASMRFRNIAEAGLRALAPEVSALRVLDPGSPARVRELLRNSVWILAAVGVPSYWVVMQWAPTFCGIFFPRGYPETLPAAARILFAGSFFSLLSTPAYYILIGLGRYAAIFAGEAAQFAVNFGAAGLLVWLAPGTYRLSVVWGASLGMAAAASVFFFYCRTRAVE